jgi:hypothetical protein
VRRLPWEGCIRLAKPLFNDRTSLAEIPVISKIEAAVPDGRPLRSLKNRQPQSMHNGTPFWLSHRRLRLPDIEGVDPQRNVFDHTASRWFEDLRCVGPNEPFLRKVIYS